MTLRVRQAQSGRRLRKQGLNQKETQVAGCMAAAEKLLAPRPGQLVLSYFSQSPGRGEREPRPGVKRTARDRTEGNLALTQCGAQRQPAALSRACAEQMPARWAA